MKDALQGADFFRLRNFFEAKGDTVLSQFFEDRIDPSLRIYGPRGFGDGHLNDDHPRHLKAKDANGSFTFQTFSFTPKKLERRIADRLAIRVAFKPPQWDGKTKTWVKGKKTSYYRDYNPEKEVFVRTLATYTQYLREVNPLTLTESDRLRSLGKHVYADRRMPDPQTRDDEDFFVTPGAGKARRTNIYIFGPSSET